jgi:hypothetical protein
MANTRPFVAAAFLCEKVLREQDGVQSAIRIVDTYIVKPSADAPQDSKLGLNVTAWVLLKSGDVQGVHKVRLVLRSPTNRSVNIPDWDAEFKGAVHGASLTAQLSFEVTEEGIHWIDVIWLEDGTVLTTMPFRLLISPQQGETQSASSHSGTALSAARKP